MFIFALIANATYVARLALPQTYLFISLTAVKKKKKKDLLNRWLELSQFFDIDSRFLDIDFTILGTVMYDYVKLFFECFSQYSSENQ